jgi:hypothetical protein
MSPSSLNSMNVSATCHFDVLKCYSVTTPIKPLTDRWLQMSHLLKLEKTMGVSVTSPDQVVMRAPGVCHTVTL